MPRYTPTTATKRTKRTKISVKTFTVKMAEDGRRTWLMMAPVDGLPDADQHPPSTAENEMLLKYGRQNFDELEAFGNRKTMDGMQMEAMAPPDYTQSHVVQTDIEAQRKKPNALWRERADADTATPTSIQAETPTPNMQLTEVTRLKEGLVESKRQIQAGGLPFDATAVVPVIDGIIILLDEMDPTVDWSDGLGSLNDLCRAVFKDTVMAGLGDFFTAKGQLVADRNACTATLAVEEGKLVALQQLQRKLVELSTISLELSEGNDDATVGNEEVDALRNELDARDGAEALAGPRFIDLETFADIYAQAVTMQEKVDGEVAAQSLVYSIAKDAL